MKRYDFSGALAHVSVCSMLVLAAHGLTDLIRPFIHPSFLFEPLGVFTLLYLPHGVLLMAAWFYGWLVVPMVLPATVLALMLQRGWDALTASFLALVTLKVCMAPLAFDLFRLLGVDARAEAHALNWRVLLLVGLVQSVMANQVRFWMGCCGELTADQLLRAIAGSVIGDMAGLIAVMLAAMMAFRAFRTA